MKGFKGTLGPWAASTSDRSIGPICRDDDQSYGMILPVAWVEFDGEPGIHHANARLIAAAPDLLEALQLSVDAMKEGRYVSYPEWHGVINKARAAIAKAIGEEE
ncbi:hypothetical protein [Cronobacter dublinensis]|uniref:hypothetical protein n=1 Tax=Cronobacter dublinensis TaxID=413497 RepID=UPI000CFFE578|nr:hypothetical protein [Cronobacter dublinensis]